MPEADLTSHAFLIIFKKPELVNHDFQIHMVEKDHNLLLMISFYKTIISNFNTMF